MRAFLIWAAIMTFLGWLVLLASLAELARDKAQVHGCTVLVNDLAEQTVTLSCPGPSIIRFPASRYFRAIEETP